MSRAKNVAKAGAQVRKQPLTRKPPETGSFFIGKKLKVAFCVLLAAATIGLYSPALGNGFVWDDTDYVTANSHVRDGLAWNTIRWAFTSTDAANWHPLTWLSHALDCQLFALRPMGHHLDNVLIHALNAVVLYLVMAWLTKRVGPSLLVAALFAMHPLNVESVAWVAERKNVLSTLLFFLAIAAYAWYARKPDWRRYLLVAALFAAGLMAKPMVITLPFVLLLLDYWPLHRMPARSGAPGADGAAPIVWSRLVLEKIPLLGLSAASAVITMMAQQGGGAMHTLGESPFAVRLENAIVSYLLYLWKMIWPARLAALYPFPTTLLPLWQVLLSALVLIGMTMLVFAFRRKRYLPFGWFWFLGTLVPVIGLVHVGGASMADRYAYTPLIGIFVMIAWSLDDWAQARRVPKVWLAIPAACLLTTLSFVTWQQIRTWESAYALWERALSVTEQNPFAHESLADALMNPNGAMTANDLRSFSTEQERIDAARQHYGAALEIYRQVAQQTDMRLGLPGMVVTLIDLGNVAQLQNRPDEAREHCEDALKIERQLVELPEMRSAIFMGQPLLAVLAKTLANIALIDKEQNQPDEARPLYEEALQIYRDLVQQNPGEYEPKLVETLMNLGFVEGSEKQLDKAYSHFQKAMEIDRRLAQQDPDHYLPDMASILLNLGNLETARNHPDNARQHFEEALKIYRQLAQQSPGEYLPDLAGTLSNLGVVARLQKQLADSRADYTEAMNIYHRSLAQRDPRYAGNVTKVEAALAELERSSSQR